MSPEQFWRLIGRIDTAALDEGVEDCAVEPLQDALADLAPEELESFEEHLSVALHAIDGSAYAANAGDSGRSADGFLYALCYVVAKGLEYYSSVLSNPTLMPDSIDQWCESLLYSHRKAWASATGKDEPEWTFDASVNYETGSNERLWKE